MKYEVETSSSQGALEPSKARDLERCDQDNNSDVPTTLRELLSYVPHAALLADGRGVIVAANVLAQGLLAESEAELFQRPLCEIVSESYRDRFADFWGRQFSSSEIWPLGAGSELYLTRANGTAFLADIGISPIVTPGGKFGLFAIVDFSDHKEGDEAIRRLAAIVESSDDAIISKNLDGIVTSWNQGAERIFKYSAKEMVGHSIFRLVPDDLISEERDILERIRRGERVDHYETSRRRKDGTVLRVSLSISPVVDAQGRVVGAAKVARDVTVQKQSDDRLRRVVESAPNAMLMVNGLGRIVLVNLQTEKTFGFSRNELIGQPLEILVPERYRNSHESFRKIFFENPAARPMGVDRELYGRRKDGSEFPVEIGLTPLETDEGVFVMSTIIDISERVQTDKQRHLHLSELAHASRLSAVGEMFSELAHEINQPLGATANYLRASIRTMQAAENSQSTQIRDWIDKASAQTTRAIEIVQRIGSFVKKGDEVRSDLDLNEVIQHVITLPVFEIWSSGVARRISPTLLLDHTLPLVKVNRVQIEQVLLNLIRNAIEAMAEQGEADRAIVIKTCKEGQTANVAVSDTGTGVLEENLNKLFTPFFSTKPNGMGIGLSISKSILEAHSGTISVKSMVGKGTTFTFSLPAVAALEH